MNAPSYLPWNDYLTLKAAFRELVAKAGGVTKAAQIARTDAPRISRYGSPNEMLFPPADVIADLEAFVGDPIVTRVQADLQGFLITSKGSACTRSDFLKAAATITTHSSGVVAGLAVGLIDGLIDPAEAKSLRAGVRQALEALSALDLALEEISYTDMPERRRS